MNFILYKDTDLRNIASIIGSNLRQHDILVEKISDRLKNPASILKKLLRKGIDFSQLTDVVAFRIIVSTIEDCYKTLDIINDLYTTIPEKQKDYIMRSKSNNYESLHSVVNASMPSLVEIQIRTNHMHYTAEFGDANHTKYKEDQEAILEKLFFTKLFDIGPFHAELSKAYQLFENFNWTAAELDAYMQEMKNFWRNSQNQLRAIRNNFTRDAV